MEEARVNPQEGYDRYEMTRVFTRERKTGILGNNCGRHSLLVLLGLAPGLWAIRREDKFFLIVLFVVLGLVGWRDVA